MNPEIQKYIAEQRQAGVSDTDIANQLKASGWDDGTIQKEIGSASLPTPIHITSKILIPILLVLVLGGSAYGAIWWWGNQQMAQEVAATFTPRLLPSATPSVSPSPLTSSQKVIDPTVSWKTYIDSQKFSFKYPSNFSVEGSDPAISSAGFLYNYRYEFKLTDSSPRGDYTFPVRFHNFSLNFAYNSVGPDHFSGTCGVCGIPNPKKIGNNSYVEIKMKNNNMARYFIKNPNSVYTQIIYSPIIDNTDIGASNQPHYSDYVAALDVVRKNKVFLDYNQQQAILNQVLSTFIFK